jgi:hypothetical protein
MCLNKRIICFVFLLLELFVPAQSDKKLLLSQTWFFNGSIHDSLLYLKPTQDPAHNNKISFRPDGTVRLQSAFPAVADSQWHYSFYRREIYMSLIRNDSLYNRSYKIVKQKDGSFEFKRGYNYQGPVTAPGESISFIDTPATKTLVLQKKNRKKRIYEEDEISIFCAKKGITHDSIEYMARGNFYSYSQDTIILKAFQLETHDFYKKYTDSLHHTSFFPDSLITVRFPTKDLIGIYYHRTGFTAIMTVLTVSGFIGELVFLPAALYSKSDKYNTIFGNLAMASIATWPTAFTAGVIFAKKKFRIKATGQKQKVWRIVSEE